MALILGRFSSGARVAVAAALLTLIGVSTGESAPAAAGLTVTPVKFTMTPGRTTTTLRIVNNTGRQIGFQVRSFAWTQPGGAADQLTRTDMLAVSPPIGLIASGGNQVVRLVLRKPAQSEEAAYRILFDEVPPPPQPGVVNFAYRFSIPVFSEPTTAHAAPRVNWSLQSDGGAYYLVAANSGARHDAFHNIALTSASGPVAVQQSGSPYVLPGATRRWRIVSKGFSPSAQKLRVTASADSGPVDQSLAGP